MPVTVVVGCQFGDEGKGKIVDYLARGADWVARYGGGANAGHTVQIGRETFVLHLLPSGILTPRPKCVIGHGVVADPVYLLEEMDLLVGRGVPVAGRLFISEGAHALLPYHPMIETLDGEDVRVGTTKRGIGPAYQDKVRRAGIRFYELLDPKRLRVRLEEHAARLETLYRGVGKTPPAPIDQLFAGWISTYSQVADRLRPLVVDTVELLNSALRRGEKILGEGAQGTFLDIDLGTYPYVTSSNTTAGGAATGLGLPPSSLRKVIGVCKAYATRVGEGPFPTELSAGAADALREKGSEFGATTGRPRRVGWCDLVQLRYAARVNGVTSLIITKLDILSGMPQLEIATAYDTPGGRTTAHPVDTEVLARSKPVYESAPGWLEPVGGVRRYGELPAAARSYLDRFEAAAECPISMVSVGSARSAIMTVPPRGRR
ncbi:MAG: adenylosuccinate synthase [Candidatus Eisenbacteria bacterium]|nr:adenylosuccinate synthase [Candidatus Eisenbacteria bacterium]